MVTETPFSALRNKLTPHFSLAQMVIDKSLLPEEFLIKEANVAIANSDAIRQLINQIEEEYVTATTVTPEFMAKRKELMAKVHQYYTQRSEGIYNPSPSADELLDLIINMVL